MTSPDRAILLSVEPIERDTARPLSERFADDVYDVLVQACGASPIAGYRFDFCYHLRNLPTHWGGIDYRISGNLGGRFHCHVQQIPYTGLFQISRIYVDCEGEDMTSARGRIIKEANERLAGLLDRAHKREGS